MEDWVASTHFRNNHLSLQAAKVYGDILGYATEQYFMFTLFIHFLKQF